MTNDTPPPGSLRDPTSPSKGGGDEEHRGRPGPAMVSDTLGVPLKYQDDIARIQGSKVQDLIEQMRAEMKRAAD